LGRKALLNVWTQPTAFKGRVLPHEVCGDWKRHSVTEPDLERARRDEPTGSFCADQSGESVLGREARDHFRGAGGVFVHEHSDVAEMDLWSER